MPLLKQTSSQNSSRLRRCFNRIPTFFKQQPPLIFDAQPSTWQMVQWAVTASATSSAYKQWTARWRSSRARASPTPASYPTASCPAPSPSLAHSTLCSQWVPRAASRPTATPRWRRPPTTIPTRSQNNRRALPSPLCQRFPASELQPISAIQRLSRN